jgi:hypothetical protein
MSLINEALKKAQKQRTGETTPLPAIGGESAERIARRNKPAGFNKLLLYLGGGGAAIAVLVVVGVLLLRKSPSTPAPSPAPAASPAPVSVAATPVVKPAEAAPIPATPAPTVAQAAPTSPAPTPVAVVPVLTPPVEKVSAKIEPPAPVVLAEAPKPVVTPAPAASVKVTAAPAVTLAEPPKAEPAKPALPGKLETRAINYIESIHVAGIRASSTDAKVLMNDRVYRIGSIVERDLGLKLTGITANSLTFEDEHGATYTRTF